MAALTRLSKPSFSSVYRISRCPYLGTTPETTSHGASPYSQRLGPTSNLAVKDPKDRSVQWVFLGSPGVGKGTYASRLSNLLCVPHIATGDLVCEELASYGPLSQELSEIVNRRKLVSDEIIIILLSKRLEAGGAKGELGFILDGFPRTIRQAEILEGRVMTGHYYPYCPQPDLTVGFTSHSDPGVLAVVLQDRMGGLQVKYGDSWVDVKPVPGALVINIGDFLQIVSNGEYRSVDHRVLANSSREPRVSIAVFFNVSRRDDSYGPLPELVSQEKPALYRQFTLSEFMQRFFNKGMMMASEHDPQIDPFD